MHEIDVTVIAFQGAGNASVSGTAASPEQVRALVESADRAAAVADAAEDRAELVTGDAARDWSDAPGNTSIQVFEDFATALGEAFSQADAEKRILYGFVFHEVTTTYLGSSTGLRLRHVQPTGHYGCTGQERRADQQRLGGWRHPRLQRRGRHPDGVRPGDPPLLGRTARRPARGALRHDPAPVRRRGHDDLRLLERRRPQQRRRPDDLLQAGWWHPDRRADGQPGRPDVQRPVVRRAGVRALRGRRRVVRPQQRLRQRPAPRPDRLVPRRPAHLPDPDPAHRRT